LSLSSTDLIVYFDLLKFSLEILGLVTLFIGSIFLLVVFATFFTGLILMLFTRAPLYFFNSFSYLLTFRFNLLPLSIKILRL